MFTTKSVFAFALAITTMWSQANEHLIISEYVEGSSNNKAIELYNPTTADIALEQYQLEFYFNGNNSANSHISLTGTIASGATFVLADNNASTDILALAQQVSNVSFFNGDDAIVLKYLDQVVDSLGQVGFDPGSEWGQDVLSTQDNTLRKIVNPLRVDAIVDDAVNLENWQGFAQDDFSDLGLFNGEVNEPEEPAPLACYQAAVAIHTIQGTTDISPLVDEQVVVEAVVVSNQQQGLQGLFLQMPDSEIDNEVSSSEGIFVYHPQALPYSAGDRIRIKAKVKEYHGLTELTDVVAHTLCASEQRLPSASVISLPIEERSDLEAYEGMRVHFNHNLVVNDLNQLGRYGELILGSKRHYIGTQVAEPGAAALAVTAANTKDSIILDDGLTIQNPAAIRYPAPGLTVNNVLRLGDTITRLDAVLHYGFGKYRLMPINDVNFVTENSRQITPQLVSGANLTIASFNVLNYFNGDGTGSGFPTLRGADSLSEFERQKAKIITAMLGINADIFGLMEIENDGFSARSAIADLVNGLNQAAGAIRYAYIHATNNQIGEDDITVGLIYRMDKVSAVGNAKVLSAANSPLDDAGLALFNDDKNRPMLSQVFRLQTNGETLAVAVNHLKSKGSSCASLGDPDLHDGQGNCNLTRQRAAQAIATWLTEQYPQTGVLIIGDLNAYAQEHPLTTLQLAGYVDLFKYLNKTLNYSYVYSGELGQLDHALVNEYLLAKVVDVSEWHINSDEPRVFDYNEEDKSATQLQDLYHADAYRSSDHDPILVSLLL